MCYRLLIIAAISIMLISGCSIVKQLVYYPSINQGNYFSASDIAKIQKGMTQQQIIYILGTPILSNPFNQQIWYYVFFKKSWHKKIKQKTLILTFDRNGILINIKNNDSLVSTKP